MHVLDCATLEPGRDPITDLDVIEAELAQYGGLADRPRLVALNKADVPEARDLAELVRADLEARGLPVFIVSAVSHAGLRELSFAMARIVADQRAATADPTPQRIVIRPRAIDESGFAVVREGEAFRVSGERPERWILQTDFSNDEAVGYLADRLARLGVEDELVKAGAQRGDEVRIGPEDNSVVFDWEPTVRSAGPGPRGQDLRIEAPEARRHGRSREQLAADEEPEAQWEHDPVDEAPGTPRRHGPVGDGRAGSADPGRPDRAAVMADQPRSARRTSRIGRTSQASRASGASRSSRVPTSRIGRTSQASRASRTSRTSRTAAPAGDRAVAVGRHRHGASCRGQGGFLVADPARVEHRTGSRVGRRVIRRARAHSRAFRRAIASTIEVHTPGLDTDEGPRDGTSVLAGVSAGIDVDRVTPWSTRSRPPDAAAPSWSWCPRARSRPGSRRSGCAAARATSPRPRLPRPSDRASSWPTTTTRSGGTTARSARSCSPPTT